MKKKSHLFPPGVFGCTNGILSIESLVNHTALHCAHGLSIYWPNCSIVKNRSRINCVRYLCHIIYIFIFGGHVVAKAVAT